MNDNIFYVIPEVLKIVLVFKKFSLSLFFFWFSLGVFTTLPLHLEKAMAPHSSTLAWKIPWTEEPGGLQSMGL